MFVAVRVVGQAALRVLLRWLANADRALACWFGYGTAATVAGVPFLHM